MATSQGVMAETPTPSTRRFFSTSALGAGPESRVVLQQPQQDVRVEQDHSAADQSDGEVAGPKGSSYLSTVPRIAPTSGPGPSFEGGHEITATGRPRLVMVTDWPVPCNSLMMRRHFALNSAAETVLPLMNPPALDMYN